MIHWELVRDSAYFLNRTGYVGKRIKLLLHIFHLLLLYRYIEIARSKVSLKEGSRKTVIV